MSFFLTCLVALVMPPKTAEVFSGGAGLFMSSLSACSVRIGSTRFFSNDRFNLTAITFAKKKEY